MKRKRFILILLCLLPIILRAQQTPPNTDEDETVKITTNLVRLDAVVTDDKGNQIEDLTATDFEILQDGKAQKITGFSYVDTEHPSLAVSQTKLKSGKNAVLPPPSTGNSAANGTGRILTFIVDDGNCTASQIGMIASRQALEKFVAEQMLPNDLVAIYQTRGASSLLQQYSSDKTQILRAARKIRWLPPTGSCGGNNGDIFEAGRNDSTLKRSGQGTFESAESRANRERNEDFQRDRQIVGSLGVVNYLVRGLARVPGRKTVFFLSDGLPLRSRTNDIQQSLSALRGITDLANRASVSFNTIDVRGLIDPGFIGASDDVDMGEPNAARPDGSDTVRQARQTEFRNTQDGLFYLAEETGGRFYQGQNNLDVPIRRVLSLEKGYYLLSYEPNDDTFKGKNYNKIEIKVKRPDLKVLARNGFLGVTDAELQPKKRSGDSELYEAIVAPLPRAGLNVQMTAFYNNTPEIGNLVRSLVHIDGKQVALSDDTNGMKKIVFDFVAVTLDEKNHVVDEFNRTHTLKFDSQALPYIQNNGLTYAVDVPVKKTGTYNFRLALRDEKSRLLGSARQLVEIPDNRKKELFLSGLIIGAVDENGKPMLAFDGKAENAFTIAVSPDVPAIRRFKRGAVVAYAYTVYNSPRTADNKPNLTVQVNLYHDGELMSEGKPQASAPDKFSSPAQFQDFAYLRLNAGILLGDYALQVIVKNLENGKTVSQYIDFEVIQ